MPKTKYNRKDFHYPRTLQEACGVRSHKDMFKQKRAFNWDKAILIGAAICYAVGAYFVYFK